MTLTLLPELLAICRLEPDAPIPDWARGDFVSITRTADELSCVCAQARVGPEVAAERGWRCLKVSGPLDFSLVGLIAGLTSALAGAAISVFVVSSYDTDFLLVRQTDLTDALAVLRRDGHTIT